VHLCVSATHPRTLRGRAAASSPTAVSPSSPGQRDGQQSTSSSSKHHKGSRHRDGGHGSHSKHRSPKGELVCVDAVLISAVKCQNYDGDGGWVTGQSAVCLGWWFKLDSCNCPHPCQCLFLAPAFAPRGWQVSQEPEGLHWQGTPPRPYHVILNSIVPPCVHTFIVFRVKFAFFQDFRAASAASGCLSMVPLAHPDFPTHLEKIR
jgi:hypothetical protein